MNKRYRCGRLMLTKDGTMETIDLRHGGGIRSCTWRHDKITFKDVHDQLLHIYKLGQEIKSNRTIFFYFVSFFSFRWKKT
jgi:hypothetical protein